MSLGGNDNSWIDRVVDEPKPTANGSSLTNRARLPNYFRMDFKAEAGVAQLYHFMNDMEAKHDTPCYMLAACHFNPGGVQEQYRWIDTEKDLWLGSASGHSLHHALLRAWFGHENVPDPFDTPPNAPRAMSRARAEFESGRLLESWVIYAKGFNKNRIVAVIRQHNDIVRPLMEGQGFTAEEHGDEMRYFYEVKS